MLNPCPSLTPPGRDSGFVWVQSDLQLARPELARQVLARAVEDMHGLGVPLDGVWCLGDALCGSRAADLEEVAQATVGLLESFAVPIVFLIGNHEMDLLRSGTNRHILPELVRGRPLWHLPARLEDFSLVRRCFGMRVFFLGDHADPAGSWWTSHHRIEAGAGAYPHTPAAWEALRLEIAASPEPVLTASHYAFPGGQRPGELLGRLLPLPATVQAHLYGHAHIGDLKFNPETPFLRDHPILGSTVRQYNISALECRRSPGSHSALLDFHAGNLRGIRIRDHEAGVWNESFEIKAVTGAIV